MADNTFRSPPMPEPTAEARRLRFIEMRLEMLYPTEADLRALCGWPDGRALAHWAREWTRLPDECDLEEAKLGLESLHDWRLLVADGKSPAVRDRILRTVYNEFRCTETNGQPCTGRCYLDPPDAPWRRPFG